MKYYHTWEEFNSNVATICQQMAVDGYKPDVIVGPGRGGYIMGVMLSHYFGVPFEGFNLSLRDHIIADFPALTHILSKYNGKNILICDDLNDSGQTLTCIDGVVTENDLSDDYDLHVDDATVVSEKLQKLELKREITALEEHIKQLEEEEAND
jgi:hypoxanthine phosphoribosyltransferase